MAALAKLAHIFQIPAIVTTALSEGGAHVTPEVAAALGERPPHTRTTADAFTQPRGGKALGVLDEMASG